MKIVRLQAFPRKPWRASQPDPKPSLPAVQAEVSVDWAPSLHRGWAFREPVRQCPPCTSRCRQGRDCDAVEQDLPLTLRNLVIAIVVIAVAVLVSAVWPWGFA